MVCFGISCKYNMEISLLKQGIRETYLKFINEKLPDFREADGESGKKFYIDALEWEGLEILEDVMSNGEPRTVPNYNMDRLSDQYDQIKPDSKDDKKEYDASLRSTLFFSPESLPDEINNLLNEVLKDSLINKYKSLIKIQQDCHLKILSFRPEIEKLVKNLKLGTELDGKCNLGY